MGVTGEKKVVLLKAIIILFFDRVNSVFVLCFFSMFSGQKTTLNLPPKIVKFCSKTILKHSKNYFYKTRDSS